MVRCLGSVVVIQPAKQAIAYLKFRVTLISCRLMLIFVYCFVILFSMNPPNRLPAFLPHLLILLLFLLITFIYFSPLLAGKTLAQSDSIQAKAGAQEVVAYHEKTGKWSLWTNSMFGGMPAYLVATDYPGSWSTQIGRFITHLLPEPANLLVLGMVGFYILLLTLYVTPWLAATGAIAFTFCSYNLLNIEAGHISKVIAIAYLPPIIAGVMLTYRGKYLIGGALTALFLALQLYGNHVQITFYLGISLVLYAAFELARAIREKQVPRFAIATLILAFAAVLSVGSHASRLLTTYEYSKESNRGKSELTKTTQTGAEGTNDSEGMDKEYAFRWSYGKLETFTLLIPDFYGGASQGSLGKSSDTYKALLANGVPQGQAAQTVEQLPLYWGQQPGTGGPAYAGAIVCFLFVLGLFIVKGPVKWWLLTVTGLFILLSWGKNFAGFNNFVFDYVPGFNKFRAVTMILSVVQVYLCLLALLAVREVVQARMTWTQLQKPLLYSLGITGGAALFFAVIGAGFFDFQSVTDARLQAPGWLIEALRDDRKGLLQRDAWRSAFFIAAAAALLWAFVQSRIKSFALYGGLLLLVLIDQFSVSKRYLNDGDFVSKSRATQQIQATEADLQILQDTTYYRVADLTGSFFDNALPSYFHHSVTGYHAAKMLRYQELTESGLAPEIQQFVTQLQSKNFSPDSLKPFPVLNMLNVKYFILAPSAQGVLTNPNHLGNAWLVKDYKLVADANAELKAIQDVDPAQTAIVDERFKEFLNGLTITPDPNASIKLTAYAPNQLTYESNAGSPQLAVFSDIYYRGNDNWQAYVDGKPQPHFRANYVLRAMVIPAGKHRIEFRFTSSTYTIGETIALISSVLLFGGVAAVVFLESRKKKREKQPA